MPGNADGNSKKKTSVKGSGQPETQGKHTQYQQHEYAKQSEQSGLDCSQPVWYDLTLYVIHGLHGLATWMTVAAYPLLNSARTVDHSGSD